MDAENGIGKESRTAMCGPAQVDEVEVVVSDFHISEGAAAAHGQDNRWHHRAWRAVKRFVFHYTSHPAVDPRNPLEDFPDDSVFVAFLNRITVEYGDAPILRLRLLGDTFDTLAVRMNGEIEVSPYEDDAVTKMLRIISGHRDFFRVLGGFLKRSNARLDIFVGNHDLILAWPKVQETVVAAVCGGDEEAVGRLRFIDQHANFEDFHRGVLYTHGMGAEGQNAIDPKTVIIDHRFGIRLERPLLNIPIGTYVAAKLAYRIKQHNPLICRLSNYRSIVRNAPIHRWGWTIYTVAMFFWTYIHYSLFAIWDIRRKFNWRAYVKSIGQAVTNDTVDRYGRRLLKKRRVRAVVLGHSHEWRRESGPSGTYINTGTWSLKFSLVDNRFDLKWRRFRWIELIWSTIKLFLTTGEFRFARQFVKLLGWLALALSLFAFLFVSVPKGGWVIWSYHFTDVKVPAAIVLAFIVVSGLLRLCYVKPRVVQSRKLTFALVQHREDESLSADLMEYVPESDSFRECV
jgi:UDP-2,3-diacylglucosamine pyrophosphatase LpxH